MIADSESCVLKLLNNKSFQITSIAAFVALALFGVFWGITDEDDEDSPDQMLADIWTNTQQAGGSLSQVILGDAACCGGSWHKCVREAEVVIKSVRHPFEMDETHEDWDDRTDW